MNVGARTIGKVDVTTRTLVGKVQVGVGPIQVYMSPDNKYLVAANQGTKDNPSTTVSIIDTTSFTVLETVETGQVAHGVVIEPSSRYAYITNIYGNSISVLDLAQQKVIATIPSGSGPNGISFSPLAAVSAPANEILLPVPDSAMEDMPGMTP